MSNTLSSWVLPNWHVVLWLLLRCGDGSCQVKQHTCLRRTVPDYGAKALPLAKHTKVLLIMHQQPDIA